MSTLHVDGKVLGAPAGQPGVIPEHEYRRVLRRFATGVAVVATRYAALDYAMTVSAFASVSLHPTRVLVCVAKTARFHRAVLATGTWAVSILGEQGEPAARWFSSPARPTERQLGGFAYRRGAVVDAALLAEAVAHVECRTAQAFDGGDHTILLGDVLTVSAADDGGPLLHVDGGYRRAAPEGGQVIR